MGLRWYGVVVDAADPARLGRWWAEVLQYPIMHEGNGEIMIGPDIDMPCLYFTPAHEGKAGKNRLHLDLIPQDQQAEVERLIDMGARHVDIGQGTVPWVVLADPEGNEFCVLPRWPDEVADRTPGGSAQAPARRLSPQAALRVAPPKTE